MGLPFYGAGRTAQEAAKGLRLEKNGVRIAFLGASAFFNQSQHVSPDPAKSHVNKLEDGAAMIEAVKAAREDSDFVIVSLHWGEEYQTQPRESEVETAHALCDAGVDVVLGTHPHVLQPLEIYEVSDGRTCLIAYSLGNFISNQSRHFVFGVSSDKVGDTRDGAILRFAIAKRDYGVGGVRAELADVSYAPTWTMNEKVLQGEGKARKEVRFIRTLMLSRALAAAQKELDELTASLTESSPTQPTKEQRERIVAIKKKIALYERRTAIVKSRLGADYAEKN